MPHAELKYSDDITLDAPAILETVERIINQHDNGAGICKGRAYPCAEFHHSHVLVSISMLTKAHRDQAFTNALLDDLETGIKAHIKTSCYFSLGIDYSGDYYVTNKHTP